MENLLTHDVCCGTINEVIIISFLMQESLHTISPLTSPMDQMKSKRNIMIALIVLVVLVSAGAIWYTIYLKNNKQGLNAELTPEQKGELIGSLKNSGAIGQRTLSQEQVEEMFKAQAQAVATASAFTPEEKAEIIKQMNTR